MANVKFNFDPKRLEKEIMKQAKQQIERNPEKLLKQKAGQKLDAACPNCKQNTLWITSTGHAKCRNPACASDIKINLEVS